MTLTEGRLDAVLRAVQVYEGLARRDCSVYEWVTMKCGLSPAKAGEVVEQLIQSGRWVPPWKKGAL